MLRNHLLVAAIALLGLPGIGSAIGIGVIGGDPTGPLFVTTQLGEVQPTSNTCMVVNDVETCQFIFNNDTGVIINSLTFSTDIATGLSQADVMNTFSCTQTGQFPLGYFLSCGDTYDPTTGLLTYNFSGVLPPEAAESCPTGNCAPDQRGIPPDTDPMDKEFQIVLTGWVAGATVDNMPIFPNGLPTFTNSFTTAPEPSTFAFLGIVFLLTIGTTQFRRRKLAASRISA